MVTVAPELMPPGFIAALARAGIRVSAGHSEATAADMQRAMGEGLTGVTHLFNAMSQMQGRAPGLVGSALAQDGLFVRDHRRTGFTSTRSAFARRSARWARSG